MLGSIARRSVVLSSRRSATKTRELRNLRRASRGTSGISARTPTRTVSVSHPTLGGLTERVERVVDTLDAMLKAGPRHLDTRQWQAAQIFRSAYEVNKGAIGNVMDFDRIRGGGAPGPPPPPRQMYACEKLNEAKAILYSEDLTIIERIAGEGWSLERCASEFWGHPASKLDRTRVGDRLRIGLDELAAKWVPEGKKQVMRTWRPREAIPRESMEAARGTTLVTPSPVAHATSRGVKISGAA
jgi:hypothetical protein